MPGAAGSTAEQCPLSGLLPPVPGELDPAALVDAQRGTPFSRAQVQQLYARFRRLTGEADQLSVAGLAEQLPKQAENPLLSLCVSAAANGGSSMSFKQWLGLMTVFAWNCDPKARVGFLFKIYDRDRDGRISPGDLRSTLSQLSGESLPPGDLDQLVNFTFAECDKDRDGFISVEEFAQSHPYEDLADRLSMTMPSFP
eukprot:TRINITY_DN36877_c0_g1_i1.p1 TRINITY_DN36877_c0_g1~~TRINITY_DN36877_c0_g1_i1.p1  ORF type:complete len:227 (+),score=79.48 TRINITY_DN36877_c0_g1_i1:88-681(+)